MPEAIWRAWKERTGIAITDGIGSTEMMHIFVSAAGDDIRPGATGKAVPGYEATVLDADGNPLDEGVGRLAIKGPTGCRYLDDPRQRDYVVNGWNVTGDTYRRDADGYYWYLARSDDMIVSSGYNIGAPEVENALLSHPAVAECAVIGVPCPERGQKVKAFVVLAADAEASDALVAELQAHAKAQIAPYKYPREIEFVDALPKTATGKLRRSELREAQSSAPCIMDAMHARMLSHLTASQLRRCLHRSLQRCAVRAIAATSRRRWLEPYSTLPMRCSAIECPAAVGSASFASQQFRWR